jgi:hypothetical protein
VKRPSGVEIPANETTQNRRFGTGWWARQGSNL